MNASHDRGVDLNYRVCIALSLLVLANGCAPNEPRPVARTGVGYVEEISTQAPRELLLQSPNCIVR